MKRWISLAGGGLCALLLLCGCLLSPQIAQLEKMKQNRVKSDFESNSRESITCSAGAAECYQLHLIKGDACFAQATLATDSRQRRNLDTCAADELLAGARLAPAEHTSVGDIHDYRLKQLESLRDLIDSRQAGDPSGADTLAQAADDFRQHYGRDPAGSFYLASARLTAAEDGFLVNGDIAKLCTALTDIDSLASAGDAAPANLQAQYNNLAKSVAAMRRSGGCT
jgi:hypothetical protein